MTPESHAWWSSLRHEGLLLDRARLVQNFPDTAPTPDRYLERLRKVLTSFQASPGDTASRTHLITCLLEDTCGLGSAGVGLWQRGTNVPAEFSHRSFTGDVIKPSQVYTHHSGSVLPVFSTDDTRLGQGHGRRTLARVTEWMRARQSRLSLVTNGFQWRLLYVSGDSTAWCESDSSQWFIEGRPHFQLAALCLLFDPAKHEITETATGRHDTPLLAAIEASRRGQSELSPVLGERVRQAVEKLVAAHGPAFLAMASPPPRQDIYVAACRVVLRFVFTLFAEARDLLPLSNPVYGSSYSLGGLIEQLLRSAAGNARERLRHRHSAWPRLVALCRLVHQGSTHEALPLLPYGGELFAPGSADSPDPVARALHVFENACFDSRHSLMADSDTLDLLTLLTRVPTRIRQGRGQTTVNMPVDFSDLSSEYIGILYEGLLDYQLRCVSEEEGAVVFLALGNEPALPLARLEALPDDALKNLIDAFKKATKPAASEGDDSADEEPEENSPEADDLPEILPEETPEQNSPADEDPTTSPERSEVPPGRDSASPVSYRQRAIAWACKAVEQGGLVPKPPKRQPPDAAAARRTQIDTAARALIRRTLLPGEWYLVREGGTRKGSGSFYTRPGLATPTIRRTLEPLCYTRAPSGQLLPKTPEEILALKTCDPSCGSGTFPVGSLRYLTEALFQSVFHHGWFATADEKQADGTTRPVIIPGPATQRSPGVPPETASPASQRSVGVPPAASPKDREQPAPAASPASENSSLITHHSSLASSPSPILERLLAQVRLRAIDDETRLRAWLKRLVVENCLYGVDLDPLAIELARLSLWVETMDPSLPFTFLDHKFRCGNGLVGAWLDTFQHYPVMAWHREGGDKTHTNFHLHYREKPGRNGTTTQTGDLWTEALKKHLDDHIRPDLRQYLEDTTLAPTEVLFVSVYEPNTLLHQALDAFHAIHRSVDDPEAQREAFHAWQHSPHYLQLRSALDLWCALWFWPADQLVHAPTPKNFAHPTPEAQALNETLRRTHRFFHWELEFPDVFSPGNAGHQPGPASSASQSDTGFQPVASPKDREQLAPAASPASPNPSSLIPDPSSPASHQGFHAILGNPPWEVQKPNSKEWFSDVDPLYRTYGKTDALRQQTAYFARDPAVEHRWLTHNARLKALSHYTKHAASPFGDPAENANKDFHFTLVPRRTDDDLHLHTRWRHKRRVRFTFADPAHPYRHQGSADINTYKLFTEQAHALLRPAGRLGFILPSGLYSDKGSSALRLLFLDHCRWEWCFGFENREGIFDIHRSFKFLALIVEKGGTTTAINTAFMRRAIEDWDRATPALPPETASQSGTGSLPVDASPKDREQPAPAGSPGNAGLSTRHASDNSSLITHHSSLVSPASSVLQYPRALVTKLSPLSTALVEIRDPRDIAILDRMYTHGVLLGDQTEKGWSLTYAREFDMTNDAKLFPHSPNGKLKATAPTNTACGACLTTIILVFRYTKGEW